MQAHQDTVYKPLAAPSSSSRAGFAYCSPSKSPIYAAQIHVSPTTISPLLLTDAIPSLPLMMRKSVLMWDYVVRRVEIDTMGLILKNAGA